MTQPEPNIARRLVVAACSVLCASWVVTFGAVTVGGCGGDGDGMDAAVDHRMSADSGPYVVDAAQHDARSVRIGTTPRGIRSAPEEAAEAGAAFLAGRPEVLCAQDSGMIVAPEASTSIVSATAQSADSLDLPSDGDLWPSCWSGNALYAAWGDGFGFSEAGAYPRPSIGVAQILGDPSASDAMTGQTLAHDDEDNQSIFKVWTPGSYYQKPTGMLCLPGRMFIAVQDLNYDTYGDAPAATIAVSIDSGQTWVEDPNGPMFDNHEFTTVMFLDYGQDASWAVDSYVYVYGLDYNWRWTETTTQPQGLYLARIASANDLLDRSTWEFFGGTDAEGNPLWTADFGARLPVLVDCTLRYPTPSYEGYSVIAQGSVVYDAPRSRYIYTSWTEYTYEFYEAPTPWGPWRKFYYRDFGPYPWTETLNGGYATTVPSKFISAEGGAMWLQSNTWSSGVDHNDFALRTLQFAE
jgi:hypothetical protein